MDIFRSFFRWLPHGNFSADALAHSLSLGDRMFLRIQDFDFAQIESNLPKSNYVCPNLPQFCPNLLIFTQFI